jgi:L-ribulokinase
VSVNIERRVRVERAGGRGRDAPIGTEEASMGDGPAPKDPVAIGIDFGTESGRVLALDLSSGAELAVEAVAYPHGVLDSTLPSGGARLGADWALQHPDDYLEVVRRGVPAALAAGAVDARRVIGIGVDFTSCTVLPATADGTPLSEVAEWSAHPHAWTKLWKHHSAQPVADRMNEVAVARGEPFLGRYGGRISSEWYFPKLIEVFESDRAVYDAMVVFVEATDWIVWQLTGTLARSACPAGYKALWSAAEGLPSPAYFEAVSPGFSAPAEKLGTVFHPLGSAAGTLRPAIAAALGLGQDVVVAVGNVDSFVSVPGCGVVEPGVLVSVVGTSICDMVIDALEVRLPGITGVMRDGIVPGSYGYEAGQPAVGDVFAWYLDRLVTATPAGTREAGTGESGYGELELGAGLIAPGSTGLVALDWWNGNRSVLGDADLSGVIAGLSLQTTREEIYRALLESVAFGARTIVDNFGEHGLPIERIVACGGIAEKSSLLMQLFADVTGRTVEVAGSAQVPARGAAMYGAVAAGAARGGFADIAAAVERLRPAPSRAYLPDKAARATYDEVYAVYRHLHDHLGRDEVGWMHTLKELRRRELNRRELDSSTAVGGAPAGAGGAHTP